MNLNESKQRAIAMLKMGSSVEEVSELLELSPAQISEWGKTVKGDIIEQTVQDSIIQSKAIELISKTDVMEDKLPVIKATLEEKTLDIMTLLNRASMVDHEQVRALNTAANIVATLHNTFFKNGPDIAIQNNISNNSDTEVTKFKGLMRD